MDLDKNKVLAVIDRLKSVEELASKEGMLDMTEGNVKFNFKQNTCDAPHCVAGWYVIACKDDNEYIERQLIDDDCTYEDGALFMARDLGFVDKFEVENYFYDNPKIWGNNRGFSLFVEDEAYNYEGFSGVIRHWQDVYDRL